MYYLLILSLLLTVPLNAVKNKKEQMLCELDTITNIFEVCYGPQSYKTTLYSWNPEDEYQEARDKILNSDHMSTREFHQILLQFCQSAKDYHVAISFCSTQRSSLPIWVKEAKNRYFIMDENTKLAAAEIILFDGLPVHYVVNSLRKRFFNYSNPLTDKTLTTQILTDRQASMGLPTPKGKVKLLLEVDGEEVLREIEWEHEEELITHSVVPHAKKAHKFASTDYIFPYYYQLEDTELFASSSSYVPRLGELIWTAPGGASNPFSGAIFQLETGEKIGYIRIPDFQGNSNDAELFRQIIAHLQKKTDALVVDLVNNPGGNILYMMALISPLISEPIANFKESILLTHQEIEFTYNALPMLEGDDAMTFLKEISAGYPFTKSDIPLLKNHIHELMQAWNSYQTFSSISPFYGLDTIRPHPKTRYTKPIIVVINELCFSCGDIFPALMQDSKRAILFGQKTAGAGGAVASVEYPNHLGVSQVSITRSLVYRAENQMIENIGVSPDVVYSITPEDLTTGFSGFGEALIRVIKREVEREVERVKEGVVEKDVEKGVVAESQEGDRVGDLPQREERGTEHTEKRDGETLQMPDVEKKEDKEKKEKVKKKKSPKQ